ncbi:MHCK/EF2 kinase domain family protein [Reticulomyxa filosa]|uniref:MHCK/EF2 kinase domain family protein n=1 Tax=Reticulomyxa filosa TaxID=46433 RepID=X6MTA4_RETFI|nr:MHCK/EF2 kinase domain family protein [Reticulomyxa filosa]|eukprot:ETO16335.1 MHCK/EF2 kinase domain family protein [Reticulomyxa filosa]
MSSWIKKCKDDIQGIVVKIKKDFPFKIKVSCVGYRDFSDNPPFETQDFTEDIDVFKKFLGRLEAKGGDDQCEDVIGGLEKCAELQWSAPIKVLFHIVKSFFVCLFEKDKQKVTPKKNNF